MACSNGDFSFKKNVPSFKINAEVLDEIREGDIVLRQGTGPFSAHIVRFMNEKNALSHCGIVVALNNRLCVVHSISAELSSIDGVQTQELADFFSDVADSNAAIVRPELNTEQRNTFVEYAKNYLSKHIPFDHLFDLKDTAKFSCTELVYFCYTNTTKRNPFQFKEVDQNRLIRFDSFFNPNYFLTVWKAKI